MLKQIIENELSEKQNLRDMQFGFQKGKSTIRSIHQVIEKRDRENKLSALVTLGVKNAFNTAPHRGKAYCKLRRRNISQYLINAITDYFRNSSLQIDREVNIRLSQRVSPRDRCWAHYYGT